MHFSTISLALISSLVPAVYAQECAAAQPQNGGYGYSPSQSGHGSTKPETGNSNQNTQTGSTNQNAQTGYGSTNAQTGYGSTNAQTGYGSTNAQTSSEDTNVQTGYENTDAQTGYGNTDVQTGYGSTDVQTGYGSTNAQAAAASPSPVAYTGKEFSSSYYDASNVIDRQVVVVGGGSSGIYSAISLKDQGFNTLVIEKKGRVGGHTETWIEPTTGTPIDYGVAIFHNVSVVTDYFKRLNVSIGPVGSLSGGASAFVDFRTGQTVNITQHSAQDIGLGLQNYIKYISQWPELDEANILPDPVPEDLIAPFGEMAKKYGFEAAMTTINSFNTGLGDLASIPAFEEVKVVGLTLINSVVNGFLSTTNHNNSQLYTNAQAEIEADNNLWLNSEVVASRRTNNGTSLIVKTPTGNKLVRTKRLLITVPPKPDLLTSFDISRREGDVFSRFINAGFYTSIVGNSGLPSNLTVTNYDQNTEFNLPEYPGISVVSPTGFPGIHNVYYGGPRPSTTTGLPDEEVQANIINDLKRLQKAHPSSFQQTEPEFIRFSSHNPFYLQCSAEDLRNGFYKDLYALQGERNTFWTGASFKGHDSSSIWVYTNKYVLPALVKGL